MSPLVNHRHERFAQLVALGDNQVDAYLQVYGEASRATAITQAYRLTRRSEIAARIRYFRTHAAEAVGWSIKDRLRYLRDLATIPIGDVGESSPFCQGVRRSRFGSNIKIPDKLRVADLYFRLSENWEHFEEDDDEASLDNLLDRIIARHPNHTDEEHAQRVQEAKNWPTESPDE